MLASGRHQVRMTAGVVVPDRALSQEARRLTVRVDPSQEAYGIVLSEDELVARVATGRRSCADPAMQSERRAQAAVKPLDMLCAP